MKNSVRVSIAAVALLFGLSAANAGEVTLKDTHLCCPACVRAVGATLGKVDGVSNASCDRAAKTVTFTAADDKAAKAGIAALVEAGFHGAAAHGDKKIELPGSGAKEGQKADKVDLVGAHLCCGACENAVKKALADLEAEITIDRKARNISLSGSGIDVNAAVAALNKAGFHVKVKS